MSRRTVIVSGGMLEEDFVLDILNSEETEFIIGVDKGLVFLYEHHIQPDYIVGDFDSAPEEVVSYYREKTNIPIRVFNPVKDASDTEIAFVSGIEKTAHSDPRGNRDTYRSYLGKCAKLADCIESRRRGDSDGQS